jgi:exopolyphosphatase / guanosine-5'-triphosphate,3'-diphosphate pyrophosphatase
VEGRDDDRPAGAKRTDSASQSGSSVSGGAPGEAANGGPKRRESGEMGNVRTAETRSYDQPVYAALDLGTNNCRLLVARPTRRGFQVVDAFSRIIRLGEGVSASGVLSDAAMDRAYDALKVCATKLRRQRVARSKLVATEAVRVASNGQTFIDAVRNNVGLDLEILSREDEAKLAVSGCASLIDVESDYALVFDIGGGSSELIWLDLNRRHGPWRRSMADRLDAHTCIAAWTSLPVGVVSLAEKFDGRNVTEESFEAMVDHVIALIAPFEAEHRLADRIATSRTHLLGTSGTVTTIAGILLGLPRYDRNRVDGCWLASEDVRRVTYGLMRRTHEQRVAEPCIGRERADLVLAGCAILEALLRTWPTRRLRVADRGLREGILATLMAEDGHFRDRGGRGFS